MKRIASPKSNPRVRSIGSGQDIPVEHRAETGEGDGPLITSSCHCSSRVCRRETRIFRIPRWSVRICKG